MSVTRRNAQYATAAAIASILAREGYRQAAGAITRATGRGLAGAGRAAMDWLQTPFTPRPTPGKFTIAGKRRASRSEPSTSGGTSSGQAVKRARVTRGGLSIASKSSGKFTKGSRRFRKKAMVRYQHKAGLNHTAEFNSSTSAVDTAWVGHTTFAYYMMYKQAIKLLYKNLFRKIGIEIVSADQTFDNLIGTGAVLTVEYKLSPTAAIQTADYTVGAVGQKTLDDFVLWFTAVARPWVGVPEVQFNRIYWKGSQALTTVEGSVNLMYFLVRFAVKSTMKIQNRTQNAGGGADGDDVEEVDVQPLYGKSYYCRGNHLKPKKGWIGDTTTAYQLNCTSNYGQYIGSDNQFKEPVQGLVEFSNVKKVGKASLDPGEIKTSVLFDKFAMYFSTLHRLIATGIGDAFTEQKKGSSRFFALEKMINSASSQNIFLAFEINLEMSATGKEKSSPYATVKSFEKSTV